jgi:hypothetical protein
MSKDELDKHKIKEYKRKYGFKKTISYYKKKYKIKILNITNNIFSLKCEKCEKIYNIEKKLFNIRLEYKQLCCTNCNPIPNNTIISHYENKLYEFISKNYHGEIIRNSKDVISPYEIDIYLPEIKIAFEFNGIYWHNEINKPNDYHLIKSDLCHEKNIKLYHVFEDDWNFKNEIVKSNILKILNIKNYKIIFDDCEIKEIKNSKLIINFLNNNSLNKYVKSGINIGIFYKNELINLMSFRKEYNLQDIYLLNNICSKLNINIIKGEEKIMNYFIEKYKPKKIITYVDYGFYDKKLYNKIGFVYEEKIKPDYSYIIKGKKINKNSNEIKIDKLDLTKTKRQLMIEAKMYRIYDSGKIKLCRKL